MPGRFQGRRPFSTVTGQEATDPQSPKEVVSGAGSHGGCQPNGFWANRRSGVVLAVGPALAGKSRLFGMPAREI